MDRRGGLDAGIGGPAGDPADPTGSVHLVRHPGHHRPVAQADRNVLHDVAGITASFMKPFVILLDGTDGVATITL